MSALPRDPLLGAARATLTLVMVATLAAAGFCALVATGLAFAPADTVHWLGRATGQNIPLSAAGPMIWVFALLVGMSVLSFLAQRLLRHVIDSVGSGDPFVPENARRLAAMAWVTLVIQVLSIGIAAEVGWVEYATGPLRGQFGFSFGGILLALVLFILARVFRQGAKMREELEGTV